MSGKNKAHWIVPWTFSSSSPVSYIHSTPINFVTLQFLNLCHSTKAVCDYPHAYDRPTCVHLKQTNSSSLNGCKLPIAPPLRVGLHASLPTQHFCTTWNFLGLCSLSQAPWVGMCITCYVLLSCSHPPSLASIVFLPLLQLSLGFGSRGVLYHNLIYGWTFCSHLLSAPWSVLSLC